MPAQNHGKEPQAEAPLMLNLNSMEVQETVDSENVQFKLHGTPVDKELTRSQSFRSDKTDDLDECSPPKRTWKGAFAGIWWFLKTRTLKQWCLAFAWITLLLGTLYLFMCSINLLSEAFKVLTGCGAAEMFEWINNPVTGLMVGAVSTALIQSSSTSTSIVVSLVGAGALTVRQASPVIMGANMGTTVTSTLAACAQIADDEAFERAFAAGTVHDMFNVLSIMILFPLEIITYAIEKLSEAVAPAPSDGDEWSSPIKVIVTPLTDLILKANKSALKEIALGEETCADVPSLVQESFMLDWGWSDTAIGIVVLIGSLTFLFFTLWFLVQLLKFALLSSVKNVFEKARHVNSYVLLILGLGITILVQSSSITTSVVTSFAGLGLLNLEQSFAVVCGANIGTTTTAMMAALVSGSTAAVQIALHHVFFNVIGVILWFPIPWMRQWPMRGAQAMGWMGRRWKLVPVIFLLFIFGLVPAIFIPMSMMFADGGILIVPATILAVATAVAFFGFLWFYHRRDGKQKIIDWFENRYAKILARRAEEQLRAKEDAMLQNEHEVIEGEFVLDEDKANPTLSAPVANAV